MESTWQPRMVRLAKCPTKKTAVACADHPTKLIINVATAPERRNWAKELEDFGVPSLSNAAMRLLSMHATSAAAERFNSTCGATYTADRCSLALAMANKMAQ
eukprot:363330-Chlamydomonas_euryale.AAC.18